MDNESNLTSERILQLAKRYNGEYRDREQQRLTERFTDEIAQHRRQVEGSISTYDAKILAAKQSLTSLEQKKQTEIQDLTEKIRQLKEGNGGKETITIPELQAEVSALEEQSEALAGERAGLNREIQQRLASIQDSKAQIQTQIQESENELQRQDELYRQSQLQLQKQQRGYEAQERAIQQQLATIQEQEQGKRARITGLTEEKLRERGLLEKQLDALRMESDNIRTTIVHEKEQLKQEEARALADIQRRTVKIQELNKRKEDLERDVSSITQASESQQTEELRKQLETLETKYKECIKLHKNNEDEHINILIKIMKSKPQFNSETIRQKQLLIGIMIHSEDRQSENAKSQAELNAERRKQEQELELELEQDKRNRLYKEMTEGFDSSEINKEINNAISREKSDKMREEDEAKKKLYNKIKEHYQYDNYCGPFSVKIYDFKDEEKIKDTLLMCVQNLNSISSSESDIFALDETKTKFYLTDEYTIVTFYITYELPEIDLDDIHVQTIAQPQESAGEKTRIELTNNDKKIINKALEAIENIEDLNINTLMESDNIKSINSSKKIKIKDYLELRKRNNATALYIP